MVARSQTVEDGGPRRPVIWRLLHEGAPEETMRAEMVIRRPYALTDFTQRLIIRAEKHTERITASLEAIRTE